MTTGALRAAKSSGGLLRENASLGAAALLVVGWTLLLRKIGTDDVYAWLGPYALLTICVAGALTAFDRRHVERPAPRRVSTVRGAAIGVAVGVVMTAGTYAAYALLAPQSMWLRAHVTSLYGASRAEAAGPALAWTAVIVVAEEALFRGLLFGALARRFVDRFAAVALALGAYVLVQVGSGSGVVALAALVCGFIWTVERELTGGLAASLASHMIWTVTVIHLLPVTRIG